MKYNSLKDQVIHRASLDGTRETAGDVTTIGWHCTLVMDFYGKNYIVNEDDQGFIDVSRPQPVDGVWAEIAAEWERWNDDTDDCNPHGIPRIPQFDPWQVS